MAQQYRPVTGGTAVPEKDSWAPFLKQLHMCSAVWALYFMHGLSTGTPTVLIPQIRREWNSTVTIDDELASWLYSASNFAALPWLFFLPPLSQYFGRKIPYLSCCIAMSTVFTLLYFSSAPYHILIAQAVQGFVNANAICVLIHLIPEYSNHRYRSMYLNIQCTTFYWGIWTANAIGTFLSWKYITVLGLICALYTFTVSFYPESPRWLANKGKFAECEAAHRWMFGSSPDAEQELGELIKSQADHRAVEHNMTLSGLMKAVTSKPFYQPLLLVMVIGVQYNVSGKFVCSIYSIEILKKITKSENAAYTGMIIMDGVTVFGMYVGSVLSKILKIRPLFFSLSFLSIGVMLTFSLYLYLANLGVIRENNIVTLGILVVYSLAISTGPTIISISLYSILIPIRYQAISYVIASFNFLVLCTAMLKFSPVIFNGLGLHGSFLFFAVSSCIATIILYVYLPETKNKTLGDIEEYFKDSKSTQRLPETEKLTAPIQSDTKLN